MGKTVVPGNGDQTGSASHEGGRWRCFGQQPGLKLYKSQSLSTRSGCFQPWSKVGAGKCRFASKQRSFSGSEPIIGYCRTTGQPFIDFCSARPFYRCRGEYPPEFSILLSFRLAPG